MSEEKRTIIQQLLQKYDIQAAFKDLFGGTINEMMEELGILVVLNCLKNCGVQDARSSARMA